MTENERAPGGEVFRYSRDGDVRIYSLRVVAGGTELWRVTVVPHDDHTVATRFAPRPESPGRDNLKKQTISGVPVALKRAAARLNSSSV